MDNQSLESRIQPLLSVGERILWVGQPPRFTLEKEVLIQIGGALVSFVIGTLVFRNFQNSPFQNFPFFYFWFAIVGFNFLYGIGKLVVEIIKNGATTYAITTRRIIINRVGLFESRKMYDLKTITNISLESGRKGTGTISLVPPLEYTNKANSPTDTPALRGITAVQQVYELLLAAKDKATIREVPVTTETPVVYQ